MDEKVLTLGDFIKEASVFQYTKEYYELVKESAELELMGTYIDSFDFMTENAEMDIVVHESVSNLFMEADNKGAIDSVKINAVKQSFMKRIIAGIKKILKVIARPFRAIASMLGAVIKKLQKTDSNEDITEKLMKLDGATEDDAKSLATLIGVFKNEDPELYAKIMEKKFSAKKAPNTGDYFKAFKKVMGAENTIFYKNLILFRFSSSLEVPAGLLVIDEKSKKIADVFFNQIKEGKVTEVTGAAAYINSLTKELIKADSQPNPVRCSVGELHSFYDSFIALDKACKEAEATLSEAMNDAELSSDIRTEEGGRAYSNMSELMKTTTELAKILHKIAVSCGKQMNASVGDYNKAFGWSKRIGGMRK